MSLGDRFARTKTSRRPSPTRTRLGLEALEGREVPATLAPLSDFTTPNTKDLYVPLTVTNTTGTVTYTAASSNAQVTAEVVTGGTTLKLSVKGTAAGGAAFEGDLTFRLFDTLAPATTARIVALVNQGFYDDLTFHRIIDGFVAQGGDPNGNGTGGSGLKIDDEFTTRLTFNSPGLLAMANSGDDTGDSQFFITDTDLTLGQQPQNLNFQHTIFGQLVAGFDTFAKLMSTPVQSAASGTPLSPVTITAAAVVQNDPNGVLRVTAPATFTGTSTITVTPADGGASSTGDSFGVTFTSDTVNDPPFFNPIADQTTSVGTGVTFQVSATDLENDPVTYSVVSVTNASSGAAVTVTSKIDQATGRVTITPPANFVGGLQVKLGVKDATSAVDTQVVNLNVAGSFDLAASSDTGALSDDNVTGSNTPTLTIFATSGQTVRVTVNGISAGNATPTATVGQYTITIPANLLKVGPNTIAGTATPSAGIATQLTPLTVTYAPPLANVYAVPGVIGTPQSVTFQLAAIESNTRSEFGYIKVDDATGRIGALKPGDAGYFAAAMARKVIVFTKGTAAGASSNVGLSGGDFLVTYIVQGGTSAEVTAQNPTNANTPGKPVAFFSITAANPDKAVHVSGAEDAGRSQVIVGWEDGTGGGDRDFNDLVVTIRKAGDTISGTLTVPTAAGRTTTVTGTVLKPTRASGGTGAPASGEVGVIVTDDAAGKIGTLNPGDAGYAAAALARARVLFAPGAAVGTAAPLALAGGQSLMFYFVPGGTAAQVASTNPTNSGTGSRVAYFSVAAANPDKAFHMRTVSPEKVARPAAAANTYTVHAMGKLNGGATDFDDVAFTVAFS
ncbi:peptidylprolyl isomerase [Gemmata sp.]|uniref:peptidylprolyl isomerase n=1 Tax=Gemmata sp. TaxID=1914242 RepID=UPI003F6F3FAA